MLREYQKMYQEECAELNRIKANSENYRLIRDKRRAEKQKKIEECRRILNEK